MSSGKIMPGFPQVGKDNSVLVCYASGVSVAGWHSKCNRAVRRASRAICKRQGSKTREQGKVTGQGRARKQTVEQANCSDPTIAGSEHWQKAFGNLLTKSEQWQTSICKQVQRSRTMASNMLMPWKVAGHWQCNLQTGAKGRTHAQKVLMSHKSLKTALTLWETFEPVHSEMCACFT